MRKQLSDKFIKGQGIEIGGLHYPLPVLEGVKVVYIDRMPLEDLIKDNPTLDVKANNIIVDSAETLDTISTHSQDFVIANHVLEHCENPLLALENWKRVLKPGGVIYAAIPNKDHTFDVNRAITALNHLKDDYIGGPERCRVYHYHDWYANSTLEGLKGEELTMRVNEAFKNVANIHFHVWDYEAICDLAGYAAEMFKFNGFEAHSNGSEVIVILTT